MSSASRPAWARWANRITILVVCLVIIFAVRLLPKGFSDDLSRIGQGLPVVVLMHDRNSVKSQGLMELLNKIRPDYAGRIEFLAVDIDSQEGRAFSRQQAVGGVVLLCFDARGARRALLDQTVDAKSLRSVLQGL